MGISDDPTEECSEDDPDFHEDLLREVERVVGEYIEKTFGDGEIPGLDRFYSTTRLDFERYVGTEIGLYEIIKKVYEEIRRKREEPSSGKIVEGY